MDKKLQDIISRRKTMNDTITTTDNHHVQVQDRRTDHWHFEKRLSLDTLIALAGMVLIVGGPLFYWGQAMERRIQTIEVKNDERAKVEGTRSQDDRDQKITILSKMDTMAEQITQLRIDIKGLNAQGSSTVVVNPAVSNNARGAKR